MASFLVDEDLPRSLAKWLREASMEAVDVRDVGLRGQSDAAVFKHAVSNNLAVLTGDTGFGNLLQYPLGSHQGIVIARFPNEMPVAALNERIVEALRSVSPEDVRGNLVIIEPGRIRLRRSRGGGAGQASPTPASGT